MKRLLTGILCSVAAVLAASNSFLAQQAADAFGSSPHSEGLHLESTTDNGYTLLEHAAFPKHSVRITRARDFCDTTVKAYSGYVDVEARHLFFYFFESRHKPETDDVMLWINGGPGGSSALGMLMELGPCSIKSANTTTFNPYAWNNNANMIFLDQPVGVGFSYADHGETVSNTEEAAKDVAAFFAILFNSFPQYKGRALHMAGESYGGRYIPVFASEIYDQNFKLVQLGMDPVNLTSVILVNGWTNMYYSTESYFDMLCTHASGLAPVLPINRCVRMKQALPRCLKSLERNCYASHDEMNCMAAYAFCDAELLLPFMSAGINMYDISKPCTGELAENLCYLETKDIAAFLSSPATRKTLHTDSTPANFSVASFDVGMRFVLDGDEQRDAHPYLGQLLDRGVRALVLAGAYDLVCNWVGNERMSRALDWYGKEAFNGEPLGEWQVDGKKAGKLRSWGPLSFASVYAAGHMAPHDKPKETLSLINRWLAGEAL